jgi:Spy/CpxP family protein refolding chaperone
MTQMKKCLTTGLGAVALVTCMVAVAASQRPDDGDRKGPGKKGPPPKGFVLGKLLPPHITEELELTPEQEKQLRALEQETRKKLEKILTPEQRKLIEKLGRRRPGPGPGPDDDGPPPSKGKGKGKRPPKDGDDEDRPPKGKGKRPPKDDDEDRPPKGKRPPPKDDEESARPQAARQQKIEGGIAWFAGWQDALKEAQRTGKPIFLISAAPHCAGVSGIW